MNKYIFYGVLVVLFSCKHLNQDTDHSNKTAVKAELDTTLVLKVDNSNERSFGYEIYEDDEDVGIRSIHVAKNYVYLSDPYHDNIKKINIKSGDIKVSKKVNVLLKNKIERNFVRDLTIFNDKLYVLCDNQYIVYFDLDLNYIGEMTTKKSRKYIYSKSDKKMVVYIGSELNDDMTSDDILLEINKANEVKIIRKKLSDERSKILPFYGRFYELNDLRDVIKTEFWELKLPVNIPNINKYYDGFNIDFTSDKIVYFDVTPKEVEIFIYSVNK